jgi:hypothetical protein
MSVYWVRQRGQPKKEIKRPWRHELLKGVLCVRWLLNSTDVRYSTPMGILIDWCELNGLDWKIHPVHHLPYYKYVRWIKWHPFVLTVKIK